jgi:predicted amidophosphoribosyltransferase
MTWTEYMYSMAVKGTCEVCNEEWMLFDNLCSTCWQEMDIEDYPALPTCARAYSNICRLIRDGQAGSEDW